MGQGCLKRMQNPLELIESKSVTRFTSEIFARRYLDHEPDESVINWAEDMATAGFDTHHLAILMGEIAPFNKFEIDHMLDRIHSELQAPQIENSDEATIIVASAKIRRWILGPQNGLSPIYELALLYIAEDSPSYLQDFYLLDHASRLLEEGDEIQFYWPNANSKNIDSIILDKCLDWIEKHPLLAWQEVEPQKTILNQLKQETELLRATEASQHDM